MPNPKMPWQECPSFDCQMQKAHNPFCENSGVDWDKIRQQPEWPPPHWDVDGEMHPDEYDKRQMEAE